MARRKPQPAAGEVRKSDAVIGQELGITNLMPVSSWATWSGGDIPPGTLQVGRDPLAPNHDELVFMLRRDGQAAAMLKLLTLPIRAAFAQSEWISPVQGGGEEETAFANLMWSLPPTAGGMAIPRSLFLNQTLLSLAHGFSCFEIVRKVPEEGPLSGMVTIDKLGYRDPRTVTFLADDHGNFQGFRQVTQFGGRRIDVTVDPNDAWYYAAQEEQNPLYGVSMFEAAFQHYQMKRKLYYISHLAAQFAAIPGRIGELPLGASPRDTLAFKQALEKFAFNTAMIHKNGYKVSPFNGNTNFDFTVLIDHHNMMMAGSILAKFLQQEDRQVLIDNGKADASADMFVQMLEAITFELSESWSNKLMPQFIDYNFGTGVYPVHRFAPLTDANKAAIQDIFSTIVGLSNINCTPEFVRTTEMKLAERLGYDIDYDEVAKEEAKAAEMQAQQAAQEAALQQQGQPQPQGKNLDGTPLGGSTPRNSLAVNPSGRNAQPTPPGAPAKNQLGGGRLPTAVPSKKLVKASATDGKKVDAMNQIALALNDLLDDDDVPVALVFPEENADYEPETEKV